MCEGRLLKPAYKTKFGEAYNCSIEKFIESEKFEILKGKVDLILTSPPYPLVSPKAYGNRVGEDYKNWLAEIMKDLKLLLKPKGSLVVEIGNAWDKGIPTMSTLPLESLIEIKNKSNLVVCQQFIWNNPNKLPGPATWVNIKRLRVKDSFTHVWWYSETPNPKSDNSKVLTPYKAGMKKLLERQDYNRGVRPSGHSIGDGFLTENKGSIPSNVLTFANSLETKEYRNWCKKCGVAQHPARMPEKLVEFFINFLTNKNALVLDPFGGSNTTGKVAQDLGRRWIYVEQNKDYVLGSKGRFK
jgi:site-specific DNA-methyltransferase (cytosine-N4-specific)